MKRTAATFTTADELYSRIDNFLPDGPKWYCKEVTLPEAPNEPQLLFYRNPVECLEFLSQSPAFDGHQDYSPVKHFTEKECTNRVYGEANMADAWHYYPSKIGPKETVNLAFCGSDKTHVTNFSGDGKVHPVYITSAQIRADIRNQPNRRAFLLLCYLPVCKFNKTQYPNVTQARTFPGRLQARLTHACLKIVMEKLKEAGQTAVPMVNFRGECRMNRVFLGGWIADKEEQNLLAALGANSCTGCLAETKDLGDESPCLVSLSISHFIFQFINLVQPRDSKSILQKIQEVKTKFPPSNNIWIFLTECQKAQLSGVDDPFWKDLPHTDICKVICHDTLHGLHKAFKDHTVQWNINRIGEFEIDNRIRRLPKVPGFRHFSGGISKISQWSGKETKDLQRIFLPILTGVQTSEAITATRAELDFIYHAGWKMLGEDDLSRMIDFNKIFHRNKHAFLRTYQHGGRELDHFHIPKLHSRHHYPENIRWLGAPYNYSTEITERYHIEIAKKAYKATNRKNYAEQMLLWLRRQEKVHLRGLFIRWRNGQWNKPSDVDTDTQFDGFLPELPLNEQEDPPQVVSLIVEEPDLIDDLSIVNESLSQPVLKSSHVTNSTEVSHAISRRPHLIR